MANLKRILLPIAACGFSLLVGVVIGRNLAAKDALAKDPYLDSGLLRASDARYQYINPLLACNIAEQIEYREFAPLEKKVQDFIDQEISTHRVGQISVYFRDLEAARWMGVNENQEFIPASLLKVQIMMAYFKRLESDPDFSAVKVFYENPESPQAKDGFYTLKPGLYYTTEQLLRSMIVDSDNGAKDLLVNLIGENFLKEVFIDLGVKLPSAIRGDYGISAKTYSLFFRILYNATFLNKEQSDQALKLLTEVQFKNGLTAGVENGIPVAHKFGVYGDLQNSNTVELHDCGIVYAPTKPYFLCVMTKGGEVKVLQNAISSISRIAYREVSNFK